MGKPIRDEISKNISELLMVKRAPADYHSSVGALLIILNGVHTVFNAYFFPFKMEMV
jgi:hypothetical protein